MRSAPRPGSPSSHCPCAPILSGIVHETRGRPLLPAAAAPGPRPWTPAPPQVPAQPRDPPPQAGPSTEASGMADSESVRTQSPATAAVARRALPRGDASAPARSGGPRLGLLGRLRRQDALSHRGGREGGGRALPTPPPARAAAHSPASPAALARPRRRRRSSDSGARAAEAAAPSPAAPLPPAPPPRPAPPQRAAPPPPPASAASAPALSRREIPLLLHAPLRLPPTRGRVTQIPAWAAAGRGRGGRRGQARPLPAAPAPRNPERRPIHAAAGRNQKGAWEGRLPRARRGKGREGRRRGRQAGERGGLPAAEVHWEGLQFKKKLFNV